jgi:glycine cleavage system H protein
MSNIPDTMRYSEQHEYIQSSEEPGVVVVGITDYAQVELGDIVYIELPDIGTTFAGMDVFGTIEAVKAVSELFCALAGRVVEVNEALEGDPGLVNRDPYGDGWMIKLQIRSPEDLEQLLTAADYAQHIGE